MAQNDKKQTKKRTQKRTLPKYVVLKEGEWYVKIDFPSHEKYLSGRSRRIQVKRRCLPETAERADEIVAEIKAEHEMLRSQTTAPITTLGEFITRYLAAKKAAVTRRTHDYYEGINRRFIAGTALSGLPLADIKLLDVQSFYDGLYPARASSSMLRKINVFLSMVFRQAMAWELAVRNPTVGTIMPKTVDPEITVLERHQLEPFLAACRTNHKFFIFQFALETFMRPQEYAALKWDDLDLVKCVVRVRRALADNFQGGGREIKTTKTRRGTRNVKISPELAALLHEHRALQIYHVQKLKDRSLRPSLLPHMQRRGANYELRVQRAKRAGEIARRFEAEDLVFPSATGGHWTLRNLSNRLMAEVLKLAGLSGFTPYSLRHSGISLALDAGAKVKAVSEQAGHASVAFTLQTYAHVLNDSRNEVSVVLSGLLHGTGCAEKAAEHAA
jgi:integrase